MAANRIKGITIDIGANTVQLTDALKDVEKRLSTTQAELKDVNRLLKLDPKNTELLAQKQKLLKSAVEDTKKKLEEEQEALKQLVAKSDGSDAAVRQQNALKREIEATTQSLKQYQTELKAMPSSLKNLADKTGELAEKTRGLSAAAAAGLTGLVGMAVKAGQTADDLNTLAKQTGFTTEELQKMQYASGRIDVSMETITGAAAKLTRQIASGSSAFADLGVSLTDANGNTRAVNAIFYDTIEALSKVENETDRDTLAMSLFGKSANELAGVIDDGGAALRAFGQEAENAGLILSQDALDNANQFNDALDQLKAKAQAAFLESGAALAENFLPAMEKLLEVGGKVLEFVANMDSGTLTLITSVLTFGAVLSPVLSAVSGGLKLFNEVNAALKVAHAVELPSLISGVTTGAATAVASLSTILPVLAAIAAAAVGVIALIKTIKQNKLNKEYDNYFSSTTGAGMHSISATQAANWMNSGEVQTIKDPSGAATYWVSDSAYTWGKANAAANGWTDAADWDTPNITVNVDHINDLEDLLEIQRQAQLTTRMGGY